MLKIILSENEITNSAYAKMKVYNYLAELQYNKLLPLFSNDPRLSVITRLMGALFSDGTLYINKNNDYREISFTVGQKNDVAEVVQDLKLLGFKTHITERTTKNKINNREFWMHSYRVKCCSTALWLLFKALGVPVGNKVKQKYLIPQWILDASAEIKKEFLSGYLGGDGPKVTIHLLQRKGKLPYNAVGINDIEFHKHESFADSGLVFANQLKEMFSCFGVAVNRIFSEKILINGQMRQIIHIAVSTKLESAYSYCKIGFAYCNQKREATYLVSRFLDLLCRKRRARVQKHQKALNLYNFKNKSIFEISKSLKLSKDTVYGWIKKGKKPTTGYHKIKYPDWVNARTEVQYGA